MSASAVKDFDGLSNVTSSELVGILTGMPIEDKRNAVEFVGFVVGNQARLGDLNATLGTLIDCMLSHRTTEGNIKIHVWKRVDGSRMEGYKPKLWLQLLALPDEWNHVVVRVGRDEFVIDTH